MSRRLRLFLVITILAASLSLLIWGYMPNKHETRIQLISPSEMQLPTPSSFRFELHPVA